MRSWKLQCIHGLLGHAYEKFMKKPHSNDGKTTVDHITGSTVHGASHGQAVHTQRTDTLGGANANEEFAEANVFDENVSEEKRGSVAHSKDRQIAMQWLKSKPFGRMVVLRAALQPIMALYVRPIPNLVSKFRAGTKKPTSASFVGVWWS